MYSLTYPLASQWAQPCPFRYWSYNDRFLLVFNILIIMRCVGYFSYLCNLQSYIKTGDAL